MGEKTEKTENTGESEKVYFLVIEYIKELVKKGDVKFGGKIPSERELMSTLGLSRNSIRGKYGTAGMPPGPGKLSGKSHRSESEQSLFRIAVYERKQLCGDQPAPEIY